MIRAADNNTRRTFPSISCSQVGVAVIALAAAVSVARAEPPDAAKLFPRELVEFAPYEKNPVFTAQGEGHWDVAIRERGWILRDEDGWHLWYTGYDGTRPGQKMLGYASSSDGLKWERSPRNPLVRDFWIEDMMVVPHGNGWYMFAEGKGDRAHLFWSTDRLTWKRIGPIDIRTTNETPIEPGPYGTPTAWFENGTWYLFYERSDLGIWLATSKDMKVWVNVQDEPVIAPGPGDYDRKLVALNQIVKRGDRYFAYYHSSAGDRKPALWTTNIATSTDLVNWVKYPGNPLFPVDENKSSVILVPDGKRNRLYTMHGRVDVHFEGER